MVNLTQPALLCFGKVPADATSRHHFLQVLSYLQAYKEVRLPGEGPLGGGGSARTPLAHAGFLQAFASEKVFGVLSEKLYDLLQLVSAASLRGSWGLRGPSLPSGSGVPTGAAGNPHGSVTPGLGAAAGGGHAADREDLAAGAQRAAHPPRPHGGAGTGTGPFPGYPAGLGTWWLPGDPDTLPAEHPLPAVPHHQGVDGDASVHDRVLWALHISGMDDLLKFLASAQVEQQWALHVLEIISLMFRDQVSQGGGRWGRGQSPRSPHAALMALPAEPGGAGGTGAGAGGRRARGGHAGAGEPAAAGAGGEEGSSAAAPIQVRGRRTPWLGQDPRGRAGTAQPVSPCPRHSRFGGSYVLQGLKAIGDRDVVFHKGLHNVSVGTRTWLGGGVEG